MDFNEYTNLARRTFPERGTARDRILNGTIGLLDEAIELLETCRYVSGPNRVVAMMDELGDVLWYLAYLIDSHPHLQTDGLEPHKMNIFSVEELSVEIAITAKNIGEAIKKELFHGKPFPIREANENCRRLFILASDMARLSGLPISTVMIGNIEKLRQRYPKGFTVR